ncbi:hypothetical protein GmRootA79_46280 [Acidovorax sp. A79]
MGQAKKRGNQSDRIAQAQARERANLPPSVKCNTCKAELTEIHAMDTRGMAGIEVAGAAHCGACNMETWVLKGSPEAVERAFAALGGSTPRTAAQADSRDCPVLLGRVSITQGFGSPVGRLAGAGAQALASPALWIAASASVSRALQASNPLQLRTVCLDLPLPKPPTRHAWRCVPSR